LHVTYLIIKNFLKIIFENKLFSRADCCKVDEPGKYPHIGGLSQFGKVRVAPKTI